LISVPIDTFLERLDSDAMHHLDEALGFAVAAIEIAVDEFFDDVGDVRPGKRGPDHFAK
jgi:hypothetical protein